MTDKRHYDYRRRSHSPVPFDEEDADFQLALRLSAELNGDLGGHAEAAAAASKWKAKCDADFEFAVRLQFSAEGEVKAAERTEGPSYLPSATTASSSKDLHHGTTGNDSESPVCATFKTLGEFTNHLKASQCPGCGDRYFTCESDVSDLFKQWYDGKSTLSSQLKCNTCTQSSCIMRPHTAAPHTQRYLAIRGNNSVTWCCESGRLLLIWLLLCGFDNAYCKAKSESVTGVDATEKNTEPPPKTKGKGKGKAKLTQHSGIGYGDSDDSSDYTSSMVSEHSELQYDDDSSETWLDSLKKRHNSFRTAGPGRTLSDNTSQVFNAQQVFDKLGTTVLSLLRDLLPSLNRSQPFDVDPPAIISDLLLESKILDFCSTLLRNDSLDDVCTRKSTYGVLLDFVQTISMHCTTANSTVFSGKPLQPELCNLLTESFHGIQSTPTGMAPAIAASLCALAKLSDLLLKNAERYKTAYSAGDDQELLSICRNISTLWKTLSIHISASRLEASSTDTPIVSTNGIVAVSEVSDSQICTTHAFATQAIAQSRSAPGRFKRLVSELNVLKTSLPPGIFVRHEESRLDVMKCVIIGPEDTPYENGMFEFDFYCPMEYPDKPPLVSFKGTGGGVAGINPNLYADGKVCLSLLGTWPGEPWKPRESTLLQVLVSVQAMIFCEHPWYNEPGRERSYGKGDNDFASDAFNRKLRELTVRIAMLDWLEKSPQIWKDVVSQHFQSNADKILRTVIEWSTNSTPSPQYPGYSGLMSELHSSRFETGYRAMLPELHRHLQKYGATVALPELPKEVVEPRPKKARIGDSHLENLQGSGAQPPQDLDFSYSSLDMDDQDPINQHHIEAVKYAAGLSLRGGYSFRGRGQTLGAGPSDPASTPTTGSDRGRGRGYGRGRGVSSWFPARGGASSRGFSLRDTIQGSKYGSGRKLGDGNDSPDQGGRGENGGGGSSKT